jgi:hypothetical protein
MLSLTISFLLCFYIPGKEWIKTKDLIDSFSFYLHLCPRCLLTAASSLHYNHGGDDARPPLQLLW